MRRNVEIIAQILKIGKRFISQDYRRFLVVKEEVEWAMKKGRPVVALESSIICQGMPFPANYQTAMEAESIIRGNDAIPATIGIIDGLIHVGMSSNQIELLAKKDGLLKITVRDIPFSVASKSSGGTTVSSTIAIANITGIQIFATGGIGGVHRGVEATFDISADLIELGRRPVAIFSAGIKSILDIPKTLEYLETQGVPVCNISLNNNNNPHTFPGFFTADSGSPSPATMNSIEEVANFIECHLHLGLGTGLLIGVPIPEEDEAEGEAIEEAIRTAVREAERQGISGRPVTPFILKQVNELTKGASLRANIKLMMNNADVASKVANCIVKRRQ